MLKYYKASVIAFGFILFAATLFITGAQDLFWNAIALGGLMIYFWVFEVIPIYLTALFPLVLSAPLGLIDVEGKPDPSILAKAYGNNMIFIFLGGFMLAIALEKWKIHLQIAKAILRLVGNKKSNIILGFLLSTGLLSMWVSNTATALMMLPIGMAVIESLKKEEQNSRFAVYLLLSIAYASSIGGVGTLVGSPPNLQMAGILSKQFNINVDFLQWFIIGFPVCVAMLLLTYFYFRLMLGKSRHDRIESFQMEPEPWTRNQYKVLGVFLFFVVFWSFKDVFALAGFRYNDESVAILGTIILFLIPSGPKKYILEWSDTEKLPWGILLLFGGGLALADALEHGGVIDALSGSFGNMTDLSYWLILLILAAIAVFGSEAISNLALVTVLVPIIGAFAQENAYPVTQIGFVVTLGASLAFMMPIGTPPNAIVFAGGHIKIRQMMQTGFVLNITAILLITFVCYFFL